MGAWEMKNGLLYIDKRIEEIEAAVALLRRNVDKQEWSALESNLLYVAAKANAAHARLGAMRQAWVDEIDGAA